MRCGFLLVLLSMPAGCATLRSAQHAAVPARPQYEDAPAAALAFSPPVALGQPPVFLPREDRIPAAFVGFDDITTTFFYLRLDDRQMDDGTNWIQRRAVSERVGVSYR